MTSVVYRKLTTSLEDKCRAPGGKKISDALSDASQNLATLGDSSMVLIEEGIQRIWGIMDVGDLPLADNDLAEIHAIADRLMGYCVTIDRPYLADCLHTLCELADAVRRSRLWLPGTFTPMLMITMLAFRGTLTEAERGPLLGGVRRCIDHYLEAPAPDQA